MDERYLPLPENPELTPFFQPEGAAAGGLIGGYFGAGMGDITGRDAGAATDVVLAGQIYDAMFGE